MHHDNPPLQFHTHHFNVNPSLTAHTDTVAGGNVLMYTQRKYFIYIKSLSLKLLMLQTKKGDKSVVIHLNDTDFDNSELAEISFFFVKITL